MGKNMRAVATAQVMQEVGQEVEGYMTSIFNKDRPDKDAEVVFLTKFIVTPDIALDFIAAVKKVGSVFSWETLVWASVSGHSNLP